MSKNETVKYIQSILKKYEYNQKLDINDFEFVYKIIQQHPNSNQKVGVGIKDIIKIKSFYGKNAFEIIRIDGTRTDFSYLHCIYPKNNLHDVNTACRNAIREVIISFRDKEFYEKEYLICPITKRRIKKNDCHVDHQPPYTFNWIFKQWINKLNIDYNNLKVGGHNDGEQEKYFEDDIIKKDFISFHEKYAKLRILSPEGNLKKGDKNDNTKGVTET